MTDSPGSNLDPAKRIELLEQRYEQLMSSINEAVYMLSPEGLLTYLSPAFETLTGWSAADWQGQSLKPLIHPQDLPLVMANFQQVLNGEEVEPLTIRILHKSGEYSQQEFVTRSEKTNGDVVGIWGVARELVAPDGQTIASSDQADDKRLADLIRSTVMSTRDPLSVITTSAYLLQKMAQDPQQLNHTQVIMTQIQSLTSLVEGLLTLSRYDTDRIEMIKGPLDVQWLLRLVTQEFGMLAQMRNIKLTLERADAALVIEADAAQIHRAVKRLVENALEHTPENGIVRLRAYRQDQTIVLEVNDNGVGIPENELPNIFEPFHKGAQWASVPLKMGLGLPIAQRIVERHGGQINVASVIHQGSTFSVVLPL